jgi:hypothetical protein
MKKSFLAGLLISGVMLTGAAFAADTKVTGVLIDAKCGKDKDETAAAKHPKACAIKCAKDGDLIFVSGKKSVTLDDASKAKAVEFLGKAESTKVTIEGSEKDGKLSITSITAADAK